MLKNLMTLLLLVFGIQLAAGCGSSGNGGTGAACGPTNCAGCCASGVCEAGGDLTACGVKGAACAPCIAGQSCTSGACAAAQAGCGPGNCPNGCCSGGTCHPGTESGACGQAGGACTGCASGEACNAQSRACEAPTSGCASTCAGCCTGNACSPGTTTDACGASGIACGTCVSGQTCASGHCVGAICSKTNPTGPCATGRSCIGGSCCDQASVCGAACCAVGQTCAGGACCSAEKSCGSSCCAANQACFQDPATGNSTCGLSCVTSANCPSAAPCCALLGGSGGSGVCAPTAAGAVCLCAADSADCSNIAGDGACVPDVVGGVVTEKAWVCRANNDGLDGDGCNGGSGNRCSNDCMYVTGVKNSFCTSGCQSDAQCGASGVGCCLPATCNNLVFACAEQKACQPCP